MKELLEALQKFQDEVVFVKAKKTANYGKYASLRDVVVDTRPALKQHGLAVTSYLTHINGLAAICTTLVHVETNQNISGITPLIHKPEDPQKWGAAITYARRYGYVTILGLLVDVDDDGSLASGRTSDKVSATDFWTAKSDLTKALTKKGFTVEQQKAFAVKALGSNTATTIEHLELIKKEAGI